MQTVILMRILAMAIIIFPERISSNVSKLKVENVLNPPQKPANINTLNEGFAIIFSLKIKTATARIRQLKMFEQSVATGKMLLKFA